MVIKDRAWHKAEIRKNQRRMAKNALRSADASALKNVKKRLRKGTKDTPRFTPKEIQAMRGELRKETPLQRSQKMAAGKGPVRETAKTHGDVWSQRWKTGGLQKTFGTKSRYGLATRPDRWTEMTRSSAGQIEPPQVRSNRPWRPIEYSTGPWQKDNGWGGPEWGRRGAVRPRWFKDPRTGEWRRG